MTKAYIPPERKIPGVGGWHWAIHPTPDFCVTQRKIYQHVGIFWRYPRRQSPTPILKFALPPTPTPDASQWNIGGVRLSGVGAGVGHVHFMLFMSISFASGTQRKPVFWWNMGFTVILFHCNWKPHGLDPQRDHLALEIPTCWYPKSLANPTQSLTDPTRSLTDPTRAPTRANGI